MSYPAIEELVPHRGEMLLVERVKAEGAEHVCTEARVHPGAWYCDANGNMPAWIGIELMAQTVATYVGLKNRHKGLPPPVGFLLGTRKYVSTVTCFPAAGVMDIVAKLSYLDPSGLGAFECAISLAGECVANAMVKVFEPTDFEAFMRDGHS